MSSVTLNPVTQVSPSSFYATPLVKSVGGDVTSQIKLLEQLKDGWLDGYGKAPSKAGLAWLAEQLKQHSCNKPLPYLYPIPDGGIQAEWSFGQYEVTLKINMETRRGQWYCMDMSTDIDDAGEYCDLDLQSSDSWTWFFRRISQLQEEFV